MKNFLIAFIFIILVACNRNVVLNETYSFNHKAWNINDTADFKFMVTDTASYYDLSIFLRNTTDYEYQNLYIFFETKFPDYKISRDTMEFLLADYMGKWLGKGSGKYRNNEFLIQSNLVFPRKGAYEMNVVQAMRTDKLNGIADFGIRIEKK